MIDTIIKISGTVLANATTNDIAAIDIPEDGEIMCIGALLIGIPARVGVASTNLSIRIAAELSFLSTNQIGVNDARGTIAGIGASWAHSFAEATETGGSGAKCSEMADICLPEGITVNAGERIHLHGSSSEALVTATATFLLYMKTKGGGRRDRHRR